MFEISFKKPEPPLRVGGESSGVQGGGGTI